MIFVQFCLGELIFHEACACFLFADFISQIFKNVSVAQIWTFSPDNHHDKTYYILFLPLLLIDP